MAELSLRRGRVPLCFLDGSPRPCLDDGGDGEECDRGSLNVGRLKCFWALNANFAWLRNHTSLR